MAFNNEEKAVSRNLTAEVDSFNDTLSVKVDLVISEKFTKSD